MLNVFERPDHFLKASVDGIEMESKQAPILSGIYGACGVELILVASLNRPSAKTYPCKTDYVVM